MDAARRRMAGHESSPGLLLCICVCVHVFTRVKMCSQDLFYAVLLSLFLNRVSHTLGHSHFCRISPTSSHSHRTPVLFRKTHLQDLSRQPDWSFNPQILALGSLQQLSAHLLEGCDFSAGERDSDLVDFLKTTITSQLLLLFHVLSCIVCASVTYRSFTAEVLLGLLVRHFEVWVGVSWEVFGVMCMCICAAFADADQDLNALCGSVM